MANTEKGKKNRKYGRNKRKSSYKGPSKGPRVKGSNPRKREPEGFCLDTVDGRMPEKFLPVQFVPLHPRPHVGNELMELSRHASDSPRSYAHRMEAESVTRALNEKAYYSATAVPNR